MIQNHKNKRRFARAYFAIEKDLGQTTARVRQEIAKEDYTFFTAVRMPGDMMTPEMGEEMLKTWSMAVQSQLHRLALHFQSRWNDQIQQYRPRIGHIGILRGFAFSVILPFVWRWRCQDRDN